MEECEKENKVSKARDNNIHNLSTNHLPTKMRKTNNPLYHPNQKEDMEECEKETKVSKRRDNNIHNLSTNHLQSKIRKTNNPLYHPNQKEDMEECEKENKVSKRRDNKVSLKKKSKRENHQIDHNLLPTTK